MIGRDWTHLGVAKLYTDIAANGYHLLYLTSRAVGQADTTRNYLNGIVQDKYKLPKGPVIMSPDRTFSALRRWVSTPPRSRFFDMGLLIFPWYMQRGLLTQARGVQNGMSQGYPQSLWAEA